MKRWTVIVAAALTALALSSCGSDKKPASLAPGGSPGAIQVVTVGPLQTIVSDVVAAYKAANPSANINVVARTQDAVTQAVGTTQPAVIVADTPTISTAAKAAKRPVGSFGRNVAVIAVSTANPKHVTNVQAFATTSGLKTEICTPTTTVGNFGFLVLQKAGVTPDAATVHGDCQAAALQQIAKGTLDAALMFRTDVKVPAGAKFLTIPDNQNLVFPFSYTTVGNDAATNAFAKFLATTSAQRVLTSNGYLP